MVLVQLHYKTALVSNSFLFDSYKKAKFMTGFQSAIESADPTSPKELSCWATASPVTVFHFLLRWTHVTEKPAGINPTIKKESCKLMYSHYCNGVVVFRPEMRWRYLCSFITLGIKSWQTAAGRDLKVGCESQRGRQALVLWLWCFKLSVSWGNVEQLQFFSETHPGLWARKTLTSLWVIKYKKLYYYIIKGMCAL